jgi:predicted DNA-binding transcriptional regulator AlpA
MNHTKLTRNQVAEFQKCSPVFVARMAKSDNTFPSVRVGRSMYFDSILYFEWLSEKAGVEINENDELLRTKDVEQIFSRSHSWIWIQIKAGNIPKPFKIKRNNYWLARDIAKVGV